MKNCKKIDVVILAGGQGSRISKFLKGRPKPMIKFDNYDFLDLLIRKICTYDINKVFVLAGFKGNTIKNKYHNKKINLVDIECVIEKSPMGTAGCLSQIKKKVSSNFIVVNGDTFFDIFIGCISTDVFSIFSLFIKLFPTFSMVAVLSIATTGGVS